MPEIRAENVSVSLLKANDAIAADVQNYFNQNKIFAINILSAPGSGKTTLLEKMLERFPKDRVNVLVGDLETERDADRIRKHGIRSFQIITSGACHLEAVQIKQSLPLLKLPLDYVFIENVGNMVCPASYQLGEHLRIVMVSTPEGDDKVLKYPKIFMSSDVLVINKADLSPYLPYDIERVKAEALQVKPDMKIFVMSALKEDGIAKLAEYIFEKRNHVFSLK
jgi:hydrogenase nickel incorporation protein HypB